MLKLILSLVICNIALFYFYSICLIFEKLFKFKFNSSSKIVVGYSLVILISYYLYFSLNLAPKLINTFFVISLILFLKNFRNYLKFFFITRANFFLNFIILIILIPALVYGEQFYIFRGNYWDSSSYLISGLLFKGFSFKEVLSDNYPQIYQEFNNIDRVTTGRPLAHYLLSLFLNLKFSIFYSYYLFKCFISAIIFLSISDFFKKFFFINDNNKNFLLSFIFIFSFWNIYVFEIDTLSHYASIPILIFLIKIFFDFDKNIKNNKNYLLIGIISSGLFIIYPEIFFIPIVVYSIIILNSLRIIKKKEFYYIFLSGLLFIILTLPSLTTNYEYLFFSQLKQAVRLNDWWGYFGSFILGKENLVLNDNFVNQLKFYLTNYSTAEILKFIHNSHFSQNYFFIYLNILPSISGLYYLLPGKINNIYQFIFHLIILLGLISYLINIIFKNLNYILFKKKKLNKILIYIFAICLIFLIYFFLNKSYWSIIKLYTYLFPFIFIFFAIDLDKKKVNIIYVFLVSLFCLYKFSEFNHGIGRLDSFPSILSPSLKKEIVWESVRQDDLKICKNISFNKNDYIINKYLNLKLLNQKKYNKETKVCKLGLEKKKFKFVNEQ